MTDGSLGKAVKYYKKRAAKSEVPHVSKRGPCITISRESGAGSGLVAENLKKILDKYILKDISEWKIYDKNLLNKIIEDHNIPERLASLYTREKQSELTNMFNELIGLQPSILTLYRKAAMTILDLANNGNVIIVGRAGNLITNKLERTFHVRLVAPLENRIERIREYYNLTKNEAIKWINNEDEARENFYQKIFKKSVSDPNCYHMIINTGITPHEEAAKIISYAVMNRFPDTFETSLFTQLKDKF